MACPRCQEDNPSRAKFCLECGAPLGASEGNLPVSYAQVQHELKDAVQGHDHGHSSDLPLDTFVATSQNS